MSKWGFFFALTGVTAALLFLVMGLLTFLYPGVGAFDSSFGGYSLAQAQGFTAALSDDALKQYLGTFRVLDTLFPVLFAVTMLGVIWLCTQHRSWGLRVFLLLHVPIYLYCDLSENAQVAEILNAGPELAEEMIARASTYTRVKWIMVLLSLAILIDVLVARRKARS